MPGPIEAPRSSALPTHDVRLILKPGFQAKPDRGESAATHAQSALVQFDQVPPPYQRASLHAGKSPTPAGVGLCAAQPEALAGCSAPTAARRASSGRRAGRCCRENRLHHGCLPGLCGHTYTLSVCFGSAARTCRMASSCAAFQAELCRPASFITEITCALDGCCWSGFR